MVARRLTALLRPLGRSFRNVGTTAPRQVRNVARPFERYRLLDYDAAKEGLERDAKENQRNQTDFDPNYRGKHLQLQFTVEDPGVFTTPWSATVTYGRLLGWLENVCAENPNKYGTERDAQVPTADKPDF